MADRGSRTPTAGEPSLAGRLTRGAVVLLMVLAAFVLVQAIIVAVALSHGGGVDAQVMRTGQASGISCGRSWKTVWSEYTCRADTVQWQPESQWQVPPYERLTPGTTGIEFQAPTDLTGRDTMIEGHPLSGHATATTRFGKGLREEFLVSQGHPVASKGWDAVRVFVPPALFALLLLGAYLRYRWGARSRRPRRRPH